ncbi:triphosphoribosyl-dephospho-CoA synthase CitG [Clostridium sp. UBA4548]|uniref:triphosphoribosyl-dephospho-CoA synthase CitG n=1 Tax=Clostridium sp. UBA4548 TaxID=1946361 RepID=UPI0025C041E0|nr:triphosphoribosyl-dephospho-CoA synthase CitG [Clostridium sp. UBA4548]
METKESIAHYIAMLAQRAILYEVSTTPKPGLVDCNNSGSHKDMNFFTFMASSSALYKGMYECTLEGMYFKEKDKTKLLDSIRGPGIQCEEAMFKATNGVNTHKGIIFSLGIICAVAGYLYGKSSKLEFQIAEICNEVKAVCRGLSNKDFQHISKKNNLTHGERLYKEYGFKGIRGEVESGFSTIEHTSMAVLAKWSTDKDLNINDLFLQMLISIMTRSEDTNIVTRGGLESLKYVMDSSNSFLQSGGMYQENAKEKLEQMNSLFIQKNISPGGSADLLAVSILLGMLSGLI